MNAVLNRWFDLEGRETTVVREVRGGVVTFFTTSLYSSVRTMVKLPVLTE